MTRVHWIDPSWETSWGIGYAVSKGHKNSVVVGHGGACPGYSTQFSTVPKTGLAVIVMVNSPEVAGGITDTLLRLLSNALAASDSPAELENNLSDYCGIYNGIPTPLAPLFSRPLFARFAPAFRRSFAVSGFLAPRRRERAKNGVKWAKFGGETAEKQR